MKLERIKPVKTEQGTYSFTVKDSFDNERTFEVQKYGAEEATDTLLDLTAICGDALGTANVTNMVSSLFRGLKTDRALAKRLIKKLSSDRMLCDGVTIRYDKLYEDDLLLSFKAIYGNIEVQFGHFLDKAAALLATGEQGTLPEQPTT